MVDSETAVLVPPLSAAGSEVTATGRKYCLDRTSELFSRRMGEESVAGWFAVRCRAGAEAKAFVGLEAAHMQAFLPVELIRITLRSRSDEVQWRPLFPGHMFAMLDPSRDLSKLREIDGIDDVVRPGGRLVPVADD